MPPDRMPFFCESVSVRLNPYLRVWVGKTLLFEGEIEAAAVWLCDSAHACMHARTHAYILSPCVSSVCSVALVRFFGVCVPALGWSSVFAYMLVRRAYMHSTYIRVYSARHYMLTPKPPRFHLETGAPFLGKVDPSWER